MIWLCLRVGPDGRVPEGQSRSRFPGSGFCSEAMDNCYLLPILLLLVSIECHAVDHGPLGGP